MFFKRNKALTAENSNILDLKIELRDIKDRVERLERSLRSVRMTISRLRGELPEINSEYNDGFDHLRKLNKEPKIGL